MGWKEKLNVTKFIINEEVDTYLKQHGFYEDTMSPRFFNAESDASSILTRDSKCWRRDIDDPKNPESTMRIFINNTEVYMEVQNGWRGFDRSYHETIDWTITTDVIDDVLDRVSER